MDYVGEYKRLHYGGWGVQVIGSPRHGSTIAIKRANGTFHRHTVNEIVWRGGRLCICTIVPVTRERLKEVYGG
jgi:hypothetical protein